MDTQDPTPSLAAFFQDARTGGGGGRPSQPEAAAALARFFKLHSYEACSADQLLALADLALRAQELGVAREALTRALQTTDRRHLAYYKLGRLELGAGHADAAAALFDLGAQARPGFAFNWMGRARALALLGRMAEAATAAERFVAFGVRPHANEELGVLFDAADHLFATGERLRSGPIYALLRDMGPFNQKVAVRLAESLISAGDLAQAMDVLRPVHATGQLDRWGRRALAQCESAAGHHQEALALADGIVAECPGDAGFVSTWLDAMVQAERGGASRPGRWGDALARLGARLPPAGRAELQARAALADADLDSALAALGDAQIQPHTRLFHVSVEVAYAMLGAGRLAAATSLAERLGAAAPGIAGPLILQTDIYLRQQMWEAAGETLRQIPAEEAGQPSVQLKQFEYYCFVGDTARATEMQDKLEATGLASRQFALPILRFLAEQQRWADAFARAVAWLGEDFQYSQIGYVLFRTAKHTGRQADMRAAIERIGTWRDSADLTRLHTALAWDAARSLGEMQQVALHAGPSASVSMARRMAVQCQIVARASAPEGRHALFLCSDRQYLCATLVALHSALRHGTPGRADCFLVVEDDAADLAERLVQPLRELGHAISVVLASEIVRDASRLSAAYGLFTSGHTLAAAAYYRIHFAQHLRRLGLYRRAVYIDSDVLVRAPLDALYATDMQGHPLAARVETSRPDVTRAITLHKLVDDLYFNSGVLLLDLDNQQLDTALEASLAAIADESVTLLFHDQCALNLGFRDRFLRLDTVWNTPVGEAMPLADLPASTAILHYLDRPKPWSAAYDGACGTLWFDAWQMTAEVIGAAEAMALFALNRE